MTRSQVQLTFRKTAACPTSTTLLSFRAKELSPVIGTLVKQHLESCDFCCAELPLLAHHRVDRFHFKPPEIPANLRILAVSILGQPKKTLV